MPPKTSLGKGLGAIFPDLLEELKENPAYMMCGIEELAPTKFQSRKLFDPEELKALADSIRESGIIQPIVVRKADRGFEIIAGERRWRAAQEAGLKTVPIVIREAADIEVAQISLIENIQRAELNPIEEAEAYQALSHQFDLSQEEISTRVGKDRSTVANTMRLLKLPEEIKKALVDKKLSAGHARALLALNTSKEQLALFREILAKGLTVRETEARIKNKRKKTIPEPTKDKKDIYLTDLEKRLASRLMTKVEIRTSGQKGVIEIRFYSNDDLSRVIDLIMDGDD
jgi:ParB family chromosome partitioning protein